MIYFYGDPHFWHDNIRRLCNRPFSSVEEMNSALIKNYLNVVNPDDEVYFTGDVAWKDSAKAVGILKALPGTKYLVIGNHDKKNIKDPNFKNQFVWCKDRFELTYNKNYYIIDHYPLHSWNGMFRHSTNLHSHTHNKIDNTGKLRFDCGVDNPVCGFAPISILAIEKIMEKKKQEIKEIKEY